MIEDKADVLADRVVMVLLGSTRWGSSADMVFCTVLFCFILCLVCSANFGWAGRLIHNSFIYLLF